MGKLDEERLLESQKWFQDGIQIYPKFKTIPETDGLDKEGWLESQMAVVLNLEKQLLQERRYEFGGRENNSDSAFYVLGELHVHFQKIRGRNFNPTSLQVEG